MGINDQRPTPTVKMVSYPLYSLTRTRSSPSTTYRNSHDLAGRMVYWGKVERCSGSDDGRRGPATPRNWSGRNDIEPEMLMNIHRRSVTPPLRYTQRSPLVRVERTCVSPSRTPERQHKLSTATLSSSTSKSTRPPSNVAEHTVPTVASTHTCPTHATSNSSGKCTKQ